MFIYSDPLVLEQKPQACLTRSAENDLAVSDMDITDPPSPSWLNDDSEIFGLIDQTAAFTPSSTSTQTETAPKVPVKSPPRSILSALLKNPLPFSTLTPNHPRSSSPSSSPSSVPKKKKKSPVFTPVRPKAPQPKKPTFSLRKSPSPSTDTVVIPSSFFKAVNAACDVIQSLHVEKLIGCFGSETNSITNLLTARREFQEWQLKSPIKREESTSQMRRSSAAGASNLAAPVKVEFGKEEASNRSDFSSVSSNSDPPLTTSLKSFKLGFPPDIGVISRPKPKTPQLEADSGEGTAFLPLGSNQSKWKTAIESNEYKDQPDDGSTGEFDGTDRFSHSSKMMKAFSEVFGLVKFRRNQLQAVNAALLGKDCFVIMPTGGGKSLCYQLPGVIEEGLTIIVSPLKSLILDQINKLQSLGARVASLSGDLSTSEYDAIFRAVHKDKPEIKILFVTPEKIAVSGKLKQIMQSLYQRKMLARFVIDEAHCVSQWGHDFRPDYRNLRILRENFPGVPMMAMTATATPQVRQDILHQLRMTDTKWFIQSFNRANLKFEVRQKRLKNCTKEIIDLIKSEFANLSGIVYCLSRNECDTLAEELFNAGLPARAYHAGMTDNIRKSVQEAWIQEDKFKIVCATIAFGMGIDKPDVRFVIHYSIPKSIEGYYQEVGRAGRDGLPATCILYYNWRDVIRLRKLIHSGGCEASTVKLHEDALFKMVSYCDNVIDCRRRLILAHFGEAFDPADCGLVVGCECDNCHAAEHQKVAQRDLTVDAKALVEAVVSFAHCQRNVTLNYLVDIFRGAQTAQVQRLGDNSLPIYGKGSNYSKIDAERLLHKLLADRVLNEEFAITAMDTVATYLRPGPKTNLLLGDNLQIMLPVAVNVKVRGADIAVVGEKPVDKFATVRRECYESLVKIAKQLTSYQGISNYAIVFPNEMLLEIADKLPTSKEELLKIPQCTEYKLTRFNATESFLDVTLKYLSILNVLKEEENKLKRRADQLVAQQPLTRPASGFTAPRKPTNRTFSSRYFAKSKRGGARGTKPATTKAATAVHGGVFKRGVAKRRTQAFTASSSSSGWLQSGSSGGGASKPKLMKLTTRFS
ncbi:hypothetical protein Aperf_G00000062159 [Anoplocephala perfoliata]